LIDEWQTVPDIWNEVRAHVDENPGFGQFILTGSTTPADKTTIFHSGAGRITKIPMKTMSLYESKESKGTVSLTDLFNKKEINIFDENKEWNLKKTAFLLCRGGWPLSVLSPNETSLDVTQNYYNGLFEFEYSENEKFRNKKPQVISMILKSYARNISTEASINTIREDVISNNNRTLDPKTLDDYLDALKDLYIIEDVEAWNPNIRSKTSIRTTPVRHFVDTSLATCALNLSVNDLMNNLNFYGLLFEDMAVRDIKIYSSVIGGTVYHYRDSSGLECDAVIHCPDGRWAAIEIKLGGEKLINEGSKNLDKLEDLVCGNKPTFKMIITATGPSYRLKNGTYIVPINCLRA
ncbi:MAG: ATP-binding protein, partial [Sphaerochaetaceae bacterium]|nr:ATP-binding protein [Sphaerochaetaceae bacterium]